jgi:hypothetical protein
VNEGRCEHMTTLTSHEPSPSWEAASCAATPQFPMAQNKIHLILSSHDVLAFILSVWLSHQYLTCVPLLPVRVNVLFPYRTEAVRDTSHQAHFHDVVSPTLNPQSVAPQS